MDRTITAEAKIEPGAAAFLNPIFWRRLVPWSFALSWRRSRAAPSPVQFIRAV